MSQLLDVTKARFGAPTVHYPGRLCAIENTTQIFGFYHPSSNHYNVVFFQPSSKEAESSPPNVQFLGEVLCGLGGDKDANKASQTPEWTNRPESALDYPPLLTGSVDKDGSIFFRQGEARCLAEPYDLYHDLFSRNSGILESDLLRPTGAVISGCGSVGSLVALELARSGVGNFLLVDPDILAYHNLSRHQCGVRDVGRFKAEALRDRIIDINPQATVVPHSGIIEQVPKEIFEQFCAQETIFVGCADNRDADIRTDEIAHLFSSPFVSIGLWERAAVGEIFFGLPGKTPCYACLFAGPESDGSLSSRVSSNQRFYTTDQELERISFEPGISADISFVTIIGVKLILDLLSGRVSQAEPRVQDYLKQFTLVCNTNRKRLGGDQVEIFSHPLQITHSLEVEFRKDCSVCGGESQD